MDDELERLVCAVRDGNIRDPDRARRILIQAGREVDNLRQCYNAAWRLVEDAERAFLNLWQAPSDAT